MSAETSIEEILGFAYYRNPFTGTWLKRALRKPERNRVDDGDRFISLWICFNSILKENYGEKLKDAALIKRAKEDTVFQEIFQNRINTMPFNAHFNQLKQFSVIDMREISNLKKNQNHSIGQFF